MSETSHSPALPSISPTFRQSGTIAAPKRKPSVLSIRLSEQERDQLEREAAGQSLSSYARKQLFGLGVSKRAGNRRAPVEDHKALSRVLGAMGKSPQIGTLKGVLRACDEGAIVLGPEAEEALRIACALIEEMRVDLLKALGLRPE